MALTDTAGRNAKPGKKLVKLSDGGGLYLLIQPNGSKLWRLGYRFNGKQKTLAFGIYPTVSLAMHAPNATLLKCIARTGLIRRAAKNSKALERHYLSFDC